MIITACQNTAPCEICYNNNYGYNLEFFGLPDKFNKPLILVQQDNRGLISKTEEIGKVKLNISCYWNSLKCFL
jgi:hypothetical protein